MSIDTPWAEEIVPTAGASFRESVRNKSPYIGVCLIQLKSVVVAVGLTIGRAID